VRGDSHRVEVAGGTLLPYVEKTIQVHRSLFACDKQLLANSSFVLRKKWAKERTPRVHMKIVGRSAG
jgi:hypothetical protein